MNLGIKISSTSLHFALKQDYERRNLKLKLFFNPIADTISNEEDKQKEIHFSHKNRLTNNKYVLVDKGNDKLTTYSSMSAEIKTEHTTINLILGKPSKTNPKDSKNNHLRNNRFRQPSTK